MTDSLEAFASLPADKSQFRRPAERLVVTIEPDESTRQILLDASAQLGVNLADVALASFVALLYRHTGQASIVIRTSESPATRPAATGHAMDTTTGLLRISAPEKVTFGHLVESVVLARGRPDFVGSALATERSVPAFHFTKDSPSGFDAQQDLCLCVTDLGTQLHFEIRFNGQVYSQERIRELIEQYRLLVRSAAKSPFAEIGAHSLVTNLGRTLIPDPRRALGKPDYPLLTESFLAVANASPGAVAIRHDGKQWTYAELKRTAVELAEFLMSEGITEGVVVALTGQRGFSMVSSMLGIFMSGGVLLTLDPKLPAERQKAMLAEAKAQMLICLGQYPALSECGTRTIHVDPALGSVIDRATVADAQPKLPRLSPWAPAYIFFTSGSTGVPKGVLGCHAGLAHFLDWQRSTFGVNRDDRAAQITGLSFDMILRDVFLALTTGATLSIPAEGDTLDPMAIFSWMAAEGISILHIVPTLLLAWVNNAPDGVQLPKLRLVFLAGEPVLDVLVQRFRARFGQSALLINFYGPTETTLIKCFHAIREIEPGPQPAGRPQPQTQVLILNQDRQLCGLNEPGEIAIRTPFRSLGYLNSAEATAKAFVCNPFRDDPDDIIYLTGDKGRYRTDGLIDVMGRIDDQVKIRGVRVEPGETEAALACHPQVKQAAVVAHADDSGTKYLVGYVVLRGGDEKLAQSEVLQKIRAFLRSRLPENLVPSEFVPLQSMPLLPNGKVNRKALAPPERSSQAIGEISAAGPDATIAQQQGALLDVWRSVLGHSRVSLDDNFIELGGDSLSAITVLVRMRRLGIPDTVARGIFQGWSIRQIVARANGDSAVGGSPAVTRKTRINQMVNVVRGTLVAILVASHWFEGLLNVLPKGLRGLQDVLLPVFNIGTPGFALVFGLGTGYIFYPRYATEARQVRRSMRIGFLLVATGIVVAAAAAIATEFLEVGRMDSTGFFNMFYSPLLYYALALLTVPAWFRIIARGANPYRQVALLTVAAYAMHRMALWLLLEREQEGFLQLCRLMLVAKFNYFNMSIGALSGVGAGIYLARWAAANRSLRELAPRIMASGALLVGAGVALTFVDYGSWEGIRREDTMPLCRWVFYAGAVLLFASLLSLVLTWYERMPRAVLETINIVAVFGQISLPVYVLHHLVLRVKHLLVLAGMPWGLAMFIPLAAFLGACWWMMSKLYRLYYAHV